MLDKMSPERPGGFYLLVLGADNSQIACVNELRSLHHTEPRARECRLQRATARPAGHTIHRRQGQKALKVSNVLLE